MQAAEERRRPSVAVPKRAVESDLKSALRGVAVLPLGRVGLRLEEVERAIAPPDWPRVGPVDIVVTNADASNQTSSAVAFVELKWVHEDRLWYLAWDLVKSALVSRLGLAERALCIVGALDSEPALMDVALLCEYSLRVRSLPWTLSVVEVRAPGDRWVSVDDRGVPT